MRQRLANTTQSVRKHKPDYQLVLFMGLLMLVGLITMYAIGPDRAHAMNQLYNTDFYSSTYFFIKQGISLLLALATFVLLAKTPFSWVQKHAKRIFYIGVGACLVLAVSGWIGLGIAQCTLGACRWFELGPLGSLQPAEFLKLGMLLLLAGFLHDRRERGLINDWYKTIIPVIAMLGVSALFIIKIQNDMGTGISLFAIVAAMMAVAGVKPAVGLKLLAGAMIVGLLFIVTAPHRIERVATFFGGASSSADADYHITHAKLAIGSGGFFGVGIGNSVEATGYLPEAINDSVFAIMGETFGFVGLVVILALFLGLLIRLLRIADHLSGSMQLMVIGVFAWIGSHVILNVAAMTGIFPLTGITLPLLSFGGTSMVFIAAALGLAFQASGYTSFSKVREREQNEDSHSRRGLGRPRYASRGRL